jgi:hypothetical protein
MRKYKSTQLPPPPPSDVCIAIICDMCGHELKGPGYAINGGMSPSSLRAIILRQRDPTPIDLCHKCFTETVFPWLQQQGVKVTLNAMG